MSSDAERTVRALPCWRGAARIEPLKGGLSNVNFKVFDDSGAYVARIGRDLPFHHVSRAREAAASRWAAEIGLSPPVLYAEDGALVTAFIDGRTLTGANIGERVEAVADLLRRCHVGLRSLARGEAAIFWVFHVIRDYARTLEASGHRPAAALERYVAIADGLEAEQVPLPIVFGHHDLLPANFLVEGERLWLVDWEYAAFGTPMFDLANLADNAGLDDAQGSRLLQAYFGRAADEAELRAFSAMKAASALREMLWAAVSGVFLVSSGVDYAAYEESCTAKFDAALAAHERRFGHLR